MKSEILYFTIWKWTTNTSALKFCCTIFQVVILTNYLNLINWFEPVLETELIFRFVIILQVSVNSEGVSIHS
jgi:hypothetical protein